MQLWNVINNFFNSNTDFIWIKEVQKWPLDLPSWGFDKEFEKRMQENIEKNNLTDQAIEASEWKEIMEQIQETTNKISKMFFEWIKLPN